MGRGTVLLAKSPSNGYPNGETLTDHLTDTLAAAMRLRERVGQVPGLASRFWEWVFVAALLHDTGKIPDGFQRMLAGGPSWGHRHEVYSLGFVSRLLVDLTDQDRKWVALGVMTHHRALTGAGPRGIFAFYDDRDPEEFTARFGSVDMTAADELLQWLAGCAHAKQLLPPINPTTGDLGAEAFGLLEQLREDWEYAEAAPDTGRTAVLLQGAVTLADHVSSAHGDLLTRQPIDAAFSARLTRDLKLLRAEGQAGG